MDAHVFSFFFLISLDEFIRRSAGVLVEADGYVVFRSNN